MGRPGRSTARTSITFSDAANARTGAFFVLICVKRTTSESGILAAMLQGSLAQRELVTGVECQVQRRTSANA
jgi:hypothetical protein